MNIVSKELKISYNLINNCCKGKTNKVDNYIFKYK